MKKDENKLSLILLMGPVSFMYTIHVTSVKCRCIRDQAHSQIRSSSARHISRQFLLRAFGSLPNPNPGSLEYVFIGIRALRMSWPCLIVRISGRREHRQREWMMAAKDMKRSRR